MGGCGLDLAHGGFDLMILDLNLRTGNTPDLAYDIYSGTADFVFGRLGEQF